MRHAASDFPPLARRSQLTHKRHVKAIIKLLRVCVVLAVILAIVELCLKTTLVRHTRPQNHASFI